MLEDVPWALARRVRSLRSVNCFTSGLSRGVSLMMSAA